MTEAVQASKKADATGSTANPRALRVAVVTPFHREPAAWLDACQRSVASQTHTCTHILVGDAATVQPPLPALVIPLPQGVKDRGDTPRAVGAMYAAGLGFDAIAFLDAGNTFDADHIARLVALQQQTGAVVLSARRRFASPDGQPMAECQSSDGEQFCDTNCLMVMRPAFAQMAQWAVMDPARHATDDPAIWHTLKAAGHARAHSPVVSVSCRVAQAAPVGPMPTPNPAPLAAIYYHPEAYTTTGPKLMGRNAAGEAFLRGWLRHGRASAFWAQVESPAHAQAFAQAVSQAGRTEPARCFDRQGLHHLAEVGLMYLPGPGLGEAAWQRAPLGHATWSLCGITHTTSSARAMDAIADLVGAPVQPWDALICTSTAVKDNVQRILQAQSEHMARRLGAQRFPLPMLPVIPLGVHTGDFAFTADQCAASRQALGLGEQDVAVLFVGRLSFHAKAHPLAMYQALQAARAQLQAAGRLRGEVVLIECGWHANEAIARAYAQAAAAACPGVRVHTLDGRQAGARTQAWSAADVFCSLSDNIQETFGITPIEAMAAGLPVVVSDWDGYKDTVRHGVDGLRVPTLMPSAGQGQDLALRHALELDNYDMYCGLTCTLVAVDVGAATAAFVQLLCDPALRRRLGDAGRARAQQVYDWRHIMGRYEDLWAQQRALRLAAAPGHPAPTPQDQPWPARMDPWHAFAAYPTQRLRPDTPLALAAPDAAQAWARAQALGALDMVSFAQAVMPSPTEIQQVLKAAEAATRPEAAAVWGPQGGPAGFLPAAVLVQGIAPARRAQVFRGLVALVKWGLLHGPAQPVPGSPQ